MILTTALLLAAVSIPADVWNLPTLLTVKENGPRTYRFTVDYFGSDIRGQITSRQHVVGDYTRGLPNDERRWNNVTVAMGVGSGDPGPGQKREFMENFRYQGAVGHETLKPEFFKSFPPMAAHERNLVWDTQMFEAFGQEEFAHLKLNEPYHAMTGEELELGGAGRFQNRDIQLTWTGISRRNGQDCAVIEYRAYFNPLDLAMAGVEVKGRSHYWGLIWVSLTTKQIEYGTLYEDVLGDMKLPGQDRPAPMNVFRIGTFEPVIVK